MPSVGKLTHVDAAASRWKRLRQHVRHLETATTARAPMNRQVGPSIVFSVLIVCFFAVALFQHDPPRSARGRLGQREIVKSPRTAAVTDNVERNGSTSSDEPRPPRQAADSRRLNPRTGDAPSARVLPVSTRTQGTNESAPIVTAGLKAAAPADSRREPASAFIVVQANETIRDVALRVYGSSERAAALWRANRDALPVLDSPLSSGMVLRTPTIR
jgi:hypothetical protein